MKGFIKNNIKVFVAVIISAIIFGSIGVYAASQYFAKDITFTPTNANFKKDNGEPIDNVEDALNELFKKSSVIEFNKGTGFFSSNNFFIIENLNYKPSEVWLIASKPSIKGKLIVRATQSEAEYWATAGGQNYYASEENFAISNSGFSYTASGWSDASIQWIAIK